jgi:hypothetical protein
MKDHYDHLYSRVHYLFVAYGAGFAEALSILKDYVSTLSTQGRGGFPSRCWPSDDRCHRPHPGFHR